MQLSEYPQLIKMTQNHTENQGKVTFLEVINKLIVLNFFSEILGYTERRLTGWWFLDMYEIPDSQLFRATTGK